MFKTIEAINSDNVAISVTGKATSADLVQRVSVIGVVQNASSPVGTLTLQASNWPVKATTSVVDPEPPAASWATLGSAVFTGNEAKGVAINNCCYHWLRAVWSPAASPGSGGNVTVHMQTFG